MKKELINILVEKRNAELECLGISAPLYHSVKKYLSLRYNIGFKGDRIMLVPKDGYKDKTNTITSQTCSSDIKRVFSLDSNLAVTIIGEWKRDKLIFHKMTDQAHKYFKFMVIPEKIDTKVKDEFSF